MKESKKEKSVIFREHVRVISEIQATRGSESEHFIKIFRHENEHVVGAVLGTLLGVFEIDDQSEDSKYIVNFLFSVAKNEYFSNPRRGAVESFEAALHKINVALAEIVKHGNINWLGKFHGTIAILEKNSIHLSVTGNGRIDLVRNGNISHISDGLTSLEANENPIKTFVEISSGRLIPADRILFLLPKTIEVIGEPILTRYAAEMTQERLGQFLRTAMVNKLKQGGAIILDIQEAPQTNPKTKDASKRKNHTQSYFSETAFQTTQQASIASALLEEPGTPKQSHLNQEYTDKKTGHIYVQGDHKTPSDETAPFTHSVGQKIEICSLFIQQCFRALQYQVRQTPRLVSPIQSFISTRTPHLLNARLGSLPRRFFTEVSQRASRATRQCFSRPVAIPRVPSLSKQTSSNTTRMYRTTLAAAQMFLRTKTITFFLVSRAFFCRLPRTGRILTLSLIAISLTTLFLFGISHRNADIENTSLTKGTEVTVPPVTTSTLREQESRTLDLPAPQKRFSYPDISALVYLNDTLIVITKTTLEIPATNASFPLPTGIGSVRTLTPMPDLNLLFLLTDTGKLFAWSPINHVFSENILPINTGDVAQIRAYLTYLYVLNTDNTMLLRFPRTPGGFGPGTDWLKQPLLNTKNTTFAVRDTIFVFSDGSLKEFSKGKEIRTFESPHTKPERLLLAIESSNSSIIGLDNSAKRLIVWNAEGNITHQYFSEILAEAHAIALSSQSVTISTPTETFEVSLPDKS